MAESNLKNVYIINGGLKSMSDVQFDSAKILSENSILNFENCNVEIHVYNDCLKIESSAEPRIGDKQSEQLSSN